MSAADPRRTGGRNGALSSPRAPIWVGNNYQRTAIIRWTETGDAEIMRSSGRQR
jgi:hypothetical protein